MSHHREEIIEEEGMINGINVTPLVDIVLVLLIIFIATAAIIIKAEMRVELPSAVSATDSTNPTVINISLELSGTVSLDGQPLASVDYLRPQLELAIARNPEIKAMIAADRHLPYGDVATVINAVRQAGITSFALNMERENPPAAGGASD